MACIAVQSHDDVVQTVQLANQTQTPVSLSPYPANLGAVLLDFQKLNQVIRHRPEEFLITVETGITLEKLAQRLEPFNQRFPFVYNPSRTMLQVLAEETPSLAGTRYGRLKQFVTGIHAVTGDGEPIHYGGEVVKNVTGYDMCKLFVGSQHRFGLLTQVTLKLDPVPEASRAFLFHIEDLQPAMELLHKLKRLLPHPEMLALFRTKKTFGWQILLTLSGYKQSVQIESDRVHDATSHLNSDLQELFLAPKALEQWVQRLDWLSPEEPHALVIQVMLPEKVWMDFPYRFMGLPWMKSADVLMPLNTQQLMLRWISVNIPSDYDLLFFKAQVEAMGGFARIRRAPIPSPVDAVAFNRQPNPVLRRWESRLRQAYNPNGILPEYSPWILPTQGGGGQ